MLDELKIEKMSDEERDAYQKGWQARNDLANESARHNRERQLSDRLDNYIAIIALGVALIALLA